MLSSIFVAYYLYFISLSWSNSNDYIFVQESVNWIEANSICWNKYNSTLATISNIQQNEEALLLCKSKSCWIGLSNIFGSYQYIDQTRTLFTSFCDSYSSSTSILNCISITNNMNHTDEEEDECYWEYNNCQQTKMQFLCNMNKPYTASQAKCNYIIDPITSLPSPIDVCYEDSNGMNNIYKCNNNGDGINLYSFPTQSIDDDYECRAIIDKKLDFYKQSNISFVNNLNNIECTASICDDYDIASVVQYNYTNNTDGICDENTNENNNNWNEFHVIMDLCFPSNEYKLLYAKLTCSDEQIYEFFYSDSDCNEYLFGSTLYQHNKCSMDGLFGYKIKNCRNGLTHLLSMSIPLDTNIHFGYINNGKISIPMNKCQSIYMYSMSYQYICYNHGDNDNDDIPIKKRIWSNTAKCNGSNYYDVEVDRDTFIDFNCNNNTNIDIPIVNINYYHNYSSIIYSKNIIINECFPINLSFSFQYKCVNNTKLQQLIYINSTNCSLLFGNVIINDLNDIDLGFNELIGIPNCNINASVINMISPSNGKDTAELHPNTKIFMFVVLALFVACCLMCAILAVLVWNYLKTQKANEDKQSGPRHHVRDRTIDGTMDISSILECTPTLQKSVISYDVEDNECDLPGIELYEARKHGSFVSPPVSPFTSTNTNTNTATNTTTLPPLPKTPLFPIDSACTNTTNITIATNATNATNTTMATNITSITNRTNMSVATKNNDTSQFIPMIISESEYMYSGEYYEPTENSETML